jgi:hypothetical protein
MTVSVGQTSPYRVGEVIDCEVGGLTRRPGVQAAAAARRHAGRRHRRQVRLGSVLLRKGDADPGEEFADFDLWCAGHLPARRFLGVVAPFAFTQSIEPGGRPAAVVRLCVIAVADRRIAVRGTTRLVAYSDEIGQTLGKEPWSQLSCLYTDSLAGQPHNEPVVRRGRGYTPWGSPSVPPTGPHTLRPALATSRYLPRRTICLTG